MSHLEFDEIVEYVSLKKLNEESILLASKVDTHIKKCDECLKLVRAVRAMHEEFKRMNANKSLVNFLEKECSVDEKTQARLEELREAFKSLEK